MLLKLLKGNRYTCTFKRLFWPPFGKGVTQKGNNLFSERAKFFPSRINPFSEELPMQESKQELKTVSSPFKCLFVLRFYSPVNPIGSCRAWSVYLTTHLLGRLSPLSG